MKIAHYKADAFLKKVPPALCGLLLFGNDDSVVHGRLKFLKSTAPVTDLLAGDVIADPARLADEMDALSLLDPARRLVVVTGADNALAVAIDALLREAAQKTFANFLVVVGDNLTPKSAVRALFETHERLAAVACYADEGAALGTLIREAARARGVMLPTGGVAFLERHLDGNRLVIEQEMDKLATYAGGAGLTLEDLRACVGDYTQDLTEELCYTLTNPHLRGDLDAALSRLWQQNVYPAALTATLIRHFQRVLRARETFDQSGSMEQALSSLTPPVFFKYKDRFAEQVRAMPARRLTRILQRLLLCDRQIKTTGMPAQTVTRMTLLGVSLAA